MKKRLRKKLHKKEFRELGFSVEFDCPDAAGNEFVFLDAFIDEAIEGNGLLCGGGGSLHQEYFVTSRWGSASEEQRHAVKQWLEAQPNISNIVPGELRDAWYGWD